MSGKCDWGNGRKSVKLSCTLDGKYFNNKYNGEYIKVNDKLFIEYLNKEIESLDIEINILINDLTKSE